MAKLSAELFRQACDQQPTLQQLVRRYIQTRLLQITQSAICNRFHSLEERLCRWLLLAQDRLQSDELPFTQEFLSHMIGARRAAVGLTAGALQTAGYIRYHRGSITVLDRTGLQDSACECYRVMRTELDAFLRAT